LAVTKLRAVLLVVAAETVTTRGIEGAFRCAGESANIVVRVAKCLTASALKVGTFAFFARRHVHDAITAAANTNAALTKPGYPQRNAAVVVNEAGTSRDLLRQNAGNSARTADLACGAAGTVGAHCRLCDGATDQDEHQREEKDRLEVGRRSHTQEDRHVNIVVAAGCGTNVFCVATVSQTLQNPDYMGATLFV
jgi:hypothetical protein